MNTESEKDVTESGITNPGVAVLHATIGRRLKASVIDGVVLLALIVVIPLVAHALAGDSIAGLWLLMYAPVFVLEPLLVSFWGQTIGQYLLGVRVVRENAFLRCPLPLSFLRFYTKAVLGLWSMIYMVFSKKHKAIHDYLAGTIVVLSPRRLAKDPSFAENGEVEQAEDTRFVYPSVLRRCAFFLIWYFGFLFGTTFAGFILLSIVVGTDRADQLFDSIERAGRLFWSIMLIVFASLAAKGRLPGAKRTRKLPEGHL
jgi:uncharacterized RDD family membrane protein YckC